MEISAANLTALFTGFDVVFQRGFEKPPSYYEQICLDRALRRRARLPIHGWAAPPSFASGSATA